THTHTHSPGRLEACQSGRIPPSPWQTGLGAHYGHGTHLSVWLCVCESVCVCVCVCVFVCVRVWSRDTVSTHARSRRSAASVTHLHTHRVTQRHTLRQTSAAANAKASA